MAIPLQHRRGTTAEHSTFTGALGEVTVDTDKDVLVVHDGATIGGFPMAKQTSVDGKVAKITSVDNQVVRFNGTTGEVQGSGVVVDDNGNLGIGVTPSAWSPLVKGMQVKGTNIWNYNTLYSYIGNNYYFDGTNRIYLNNGYAQELSMLSNGSMAFSTAPNGTSGTTATFTTALTIPNTGGIQLPNTAIANATTLDWYEEATATLTATGMTTSPTGTGIFTRNGNTVTLTVPTISGTSNATTFTLTGIPINFRPSASRGMLLMGTDNNINTFINGVLDTGGTITLYPQTGTNGWSSSGTKATKTMTIQYHI